MQFPPNAAQRRETVTSAARGQRNTLLRVAVASSRPTAVTSMRFAGLKSILK
jgi:hypothetical protein